MYHIFLSNMGYGFPDRFSTFDAAVAFAKTKGFEATIYHNKAPVGHWSPISGATCFY